eukprot:CAMPEP_0183568148 /NCGR_PEP_ID=MMETSP0371-20130417/116331_1 /TAXON_ID=268820 /ORGANISM="Peridinium aciculiferum, Strain PAER-2" /LENGTH=93 /DNA_ID=CAMNT_0025777609 /DNA_START=26 /DNA_END=305 /DNA_ORIENTATION=-
MTRSHDCGNHGLNKDGGTQPADRIHNCHHTAHEPSATQKGDGKSHKPAKAANAHTGPVSTGATLSVWPSRWASTPRYSLLPPYAAATAAAAAA